MRQNIESEKDMRNEEYLRGIDQGSAQLEVGEGQKHELIVFHQDIT